MDLNLENEKDKNNYLSESYRGILIAPSMLLVFSLLIITHTIPEQRNHHLHQNRPNRYSVPAAIL
jgi:hypothetical protein